MNGWISGRLGDVLQKTETVDPRKFPEKTFSYIDVSSVNNRTFSIEEVSVLRGSEAPSRARKLVRANDVIFATVRPTLRRIAIVPETYDREVCSTGYFVLRGKDFIDNRFLYYYLLSDGFDRRMEKLQKGASYPAVTDGEVREQPFIYPPIAEQKRIVAILDEAFEAIDKAKQNAEKNLQNARELFESHLHSVFTQRGDGWGEAKLNGLTTKIGSGATPRGGEAAYKSQGISLIRSLNVHDYEFRYRKLAFLDDAQAEDLSNVEVQPRDVLLNITGASVARCCIVPADVLPARVNQHVSIIRPIPEKLDAEYLHYLLISKPYKDQLLNTGAGGGSTRQAITKAQIQDLSVMFPTTVAEQKQIVAGLDGLSGQVGRLESVYRRKLAALDELKKSLLQRAFSGKL